MVVRTHPPVILAFTPSQASYSLAAVTLGVVGALLLHFIVIRFLIVGMSTANVPASPYNAAGSDFGALLLIPLENSADSDGQRHHDIQLPAVIQRKLVIFVEPGPLPALHIDSTHLEVMRTNAKMLDTAAFVKMCRDNYPDAAHLNHDLATVSLRRFGKADESNGQNIVEVSGGDRQRALMAIRCLRAFGTFGAAETIPVKTGS